MNYQIECNVCQATCWVRGVAEEPGTIMLEDVDDDDFCAHEDYGIIDQEEEFDED